MTSPADTTDFLAIHLCLRRGGRALAEAVSALDGNTGDRRRIEALGRYWRGYAGEVLLHHTVEDDIFLPALIERAPVAAEHIGRIDADHHLLDELMAEGHAAMAELVEGGASASAARVLHHLDDAMRVHLDYEDADVVPLFAHHFDHAEYEQLHQAALKSLGVTKQVLFAVPFISSWLPLELREKMFEGAPLPLRAVHRLTRRSHERLATTALGDARTRMLDADLVPA